MLVVPFLGAWIAAASATDTPMALLWLTPTGELNHVRSSEFLAQLDDRFDADTDLEVTPLDAGQVVDCRGKLSCIIQTARPDYDRSVYLLPNGTLAPFSEHQRYLEDRNIKVPRLLLVVTGIGTSDGDTLTAILVDTQRALEVRHQAERMDRQAEFRIREAAILGSSFRATVTAPGELPGKLDALMQQHLRPILDSLGHWRPYGQLVVQSPIAGAGIEVDGTLVGTTKPGSTVVDDVRFGQRNVRVTHPEFKPFETSLQVSKQAQTRVEVQLDPLPRKGDEVFRKTVFWSGIVTAAAGVGITIAGIVDASDAQTVACVDCSGSRFLPFGASPPQDPLGVPDESGPLAIPLGYSLALTGATWSVGSLLTPEGKSPWLPLVGGLVGGVAAYAVSAALNPDPYSR